MHLIAVMFDNYLSYGMLLTIKFKQFRIVYGGSDLEYWWLEVTSGVKWNVCL